MDTNTLRDFYTTERFGFHVSQPAFGLTTGTSSLFLVTGGAVEVTLMIGQVSTIIQNSDPGISVTSRATTGLAVVLNSTVDINTAEVGAWIRVNGAGTALVLSNGGACLSSAVPSNFIVPIGNIALITTTTKTGAINWDLWYFPLDAGAIVAAA